MAGMLYKTLPKFRDALILALLITVVGLAVACGGSATPTSPEPGTTPTTSHPSLVPETSSPTTPLSVGQHLRFDRVPAEQGLSQTTVICILQDNQGFMWFGTEDGLNRYDGYSFKVYKHDPEDPNSLSNSWILSMIKDRSGVLWIGTANGGLNRFDLEANRITRYLNDPDDSHSLSNNRVLSLFEDGAGDLWVGTEFGLNRFVSETESFTHYRHDPTAPASLSGDSVRAIFQDQDGNLWIGTDEGLDRYDPDSEGFAHFPNDPNNAHSLSHNSVRAIHQDSAGALWIGTDDGLNKLEPGSERFVRYKKGADDSPGLISNEIWSIFEDRSGVLWVGTDGGGLDFYDRKSDTFVNHHHDPLDLSSLSNNFVKSIFQDREGVLWIGTIAGDLNKLDLDKRVFAHYKNDPNNPNSLSNNWVRSFLEDQSGAIWIGTGGGGLNRFDPENGRFTHYVHDPDNPNTLSHNYVSHMIQDSLGTLWIGTGSGLDQLDPTTGEFAHYQHDPSDPYSLSENDYVWFILEDHKGVLWVATNGGGLNRFDRETETFTRYLHDPNDPQSLIHNDIWEIVQNQDGMLWIGTGGGLDRFDPETGVFTHYQNDPDDPSSLSHDFVGPILEAHNGVTWFGTIGGGLNRLDRATGDFTHFREKDGLPSDIILEFLEADAPHDSEGGHFWLITPNGISKFDPRTETFQNYDRTDGLPFLEFNGGALIRSSSGRLYAGGLEGFIAFHPDQVRHNPTIPPVVITGITQGGEEIPIEKASGDLPEITFEWPNNAFEFEYAALSYADPDENQYAYYLEGLEETWNEVGTRRYGRYTNLPGGTYTLRVKGSNNDGVWNEAGAAVQVTIVPPFWATWWFRGVVLLVLVGGTIGGYRLRVRSVEARSRELEAQVEQRTAQLRQEIEQRVQVEEALRRSEMEKAVAAERNRLARELHDSVTQSLYSLTLLAEAGQRMINARDLQQIEGNQARLGEIAQQALQEMRLLVYELRPLALESEGLIGALEQRLETIERRVGIQARVLVEGEVELAAGLEEELYRIAQEALNNALKHARASQVVLSVRVAEGSVALVVADNGQGFDPADIHDKGGLGLISMQERADKIGGHLTVHSAPGEGTSVRVSVGVPERSHEFPSAEGGVR
jgi:signal transduction histidine kinase/ligand-binding sensor domain-containing protein